jgi:ubiquinone/menaquinone biosynthesis C-methylase UbiE
VNDRQIVNDDAYRREYGRWHEQMGRVEAESPLAYPWYESVHRRLEPISTGRLLEVGCGRGQFAIWLAKKKRSLQIIGLDFSDMAVSLARQRAAAEQVGVEFVQGDAQALPYADKSFDIVISCECMEHVPSPSKMALEIARVLKPGGRFLLTTENYFNGMLLGWLMSWLRGEPFNSGSGVQPRENFFVFWMVSGYLRKAGLTVAQKEASHYQWLLLPRVAPSRLCTQQFNSPWARRLAKPFGRHFTFIGHKPTT